MLKPIVFGLLVLIILATPLTATETPKSLSDEALYYRCFGQMTRTRLKSSEADLIKVKSGEKSAVDACVSLIDRASLTGNAGTTIANINDQVARDTLRTMHDFHFGWLSEYSLDALNGGCQGRSDGDIYDPSSPALPITHSLFRSDVNYSSILQGQKVFKSIKDSSNENTTKGARSGRVVTPFIYEKADATEDFWNVPYLPKGHIIGVEEAAPSILPRASNGYTDIDIYKSYGAGALGTQVYLMMNIGNVRLLANGAASMPRNWSKAILKNFLCRELPVLREGDAKPYISTHPDTPTFRQSSSCLQCHATMDRMAAVSRNFRYTRTHDTCVESSTAPKPVSNIMFSQNVTQPDAQLWPETADSNYFRRAPKGRLYYRSYDGSLVNLPLNNLEDLGQKLTQQKDFYACAAKHYYEFFTGVSADLSDIGNPLNPITLNAKQKFHRDTVIELGTKLQTHQDLKQLVKDIISLPHYRYIDYGSGGNDE